ncbi:MAG: alpha/beta fold hydrolase [Chthoniobacterales bacterium]
MKTAKLAGVVLALGLATSACRKHDDAAQRGPLQPCRLPGIEEELMCGKLTVPENRQTRVGRTIDLNVVVLPALDGKTTDAPLFDLAGGPGASSIAGASFYAQEGREFRRGRDVVLLDQRGTGESNPLAAAPRLKSPQDFLTEMYPTAYVETLRSALEKKADLTQYTTSIAMDDLDDVRAWLGYERINLFGLSYGTRAALVYMRQHPERVRSAVLMGVAPTNLKMPLHHARAANRAMDLLLDDCAGDAKCREAFPEIRRESEAVVARLETEPARVSYAMPDGSGSVTVEIRADIFAEKLRSRMYSPGGARQLPLVIHHAAQGNFEPFLQLAIPKDRARPDFIADGMYLSVTCAEDTPFIDQAEAARANAGNPFGSYRVLQQSRACSMWPRGTLPAGYQDAVNSDIPALLISGNMDPVTPPEFAEEVGRHLSNSRHVVIPQHAHVPDGLINAECLDKLMLQFYATADAKNLDTACLAEVRAPPFATELEELGAQR